MLIPPTLPRVPRAPDTFSVSRQVAVVFCIPPQDVSGHIHFLYFTIMMQMPTSIYRFYLCSLMLYLASSFPLGAQQTAETALRYQQQAGGYALLYNGEEELKYTRRYLNQPYFRGADCTRGDLYAWGLCYRKIDMRIDLYKQQLIVRSPDQRFHLIIPAVQVDSVRLYDHTLFYNHATPQGIKELSEGYYFRLHKGERCTLLRRQWMETMQEETNKVIRIRFKPVDRYYFFDGLVWKTVKSKSALLKCMRGHTKELKAYIKQQKFSFKKDKKEAAFTALARYYETLR